MQITKNALIVVDMQNDFINGSLAVPHANEIIANVQKIINKHRKNGDLLISTMDFHPKNHMSFTQFGGTWPEHCVVGTHGWKIHKDIDLGKFHRNIEKGTNPQFESYSGFFDEKDTSNGLHEFLVQHQVENVYVCGLALDFCVKQTVLDAVKLKYQTYLYTNGTKPVFQENEAQDLANFRTRGVAFVTI